MYDHPRVRIVGGEPLVGGTIAMLLGEVGYEARFHAGKAVEGSEWRERGRNFISDADIVILAPGLESGLRSLALAESEVPVLELVNTRSGDSGNYTLLWPCRIEDLRDAIQILIALR